MEKQRLKEQMRARRENLERLRLQQQSVEMNAGISGEVRR
jgi:hypothetical protein